VFNIILKIERVIIFEEHIFTNWSLIVRWNYVINKISLYSHLKLIHRILATTLFTK